MLIAFGILNEGMVLTIAAKGRLSFEPKKCMYEDAPAAIKGSCDMKGVSNMRAVEANKGISSVKGGII